MAIRYIISSVLSVFLLFSYTTYADQLIQLSPDSQVQTLENQEVEVVQPEVQLDVAPNAQVIADNIPSACKSCDCRGGACAVCYPAGCYSGCVECVYQDKNVLDQPSATPGIPSSPLPIKTLEAR